MSLSLIILTCSALGAFGGLTLLFVGIHGRRIGTRPVCGRCAYDLGGSTDREACPECGQKLKEPGAVRIGERKRSLVLAAVGLALFGAGAASTGISAASRISPAAVAASKPTWLLRTEIAYDADSAASAAAELEVRRASGALGGSALSGVIDALLKVQANQARPVWHNEYGVLLGGAFSAGQMSAPQEDAFLRVGLIVQPRLRSMVRSGDAAVLWLGASEDRLLGASMSGVAVNMSIANLRAEFEDQAGNIAAVIEQPGSRNAFASGGFGSSLGVHVRVPVQAGEYTVKLSGDLEFASGSMKSPVVLSGSRDLKVTVVAPDEVLVRQVVDPSMRERVRGAVSDIEITVSGRDLKRQVGTKYRRSVAPVWLIGSLVCEQVCEDGVIRRFELAAVGVEPGASVPDEVGVMRVSVSDRRECPELLRSGKARVLVVPDLKEAERREGVDSAWAEEVDLGDVEIVEVP